jgi:hypothetical protein
MFRPTKNSQSAQLPTLPTLSGLHHASYELIRLYVLQMSRTCELKPLVLMLVLMLGRGTRCKRRGGAVLLPPDSTGLVGVPPAEKPLLPLKFWANPRKSPLKPRRRDLDEPTLLRLMGQDFDSKWMRRTPPSHTYTQVYRKIAFDVLQFHAEGRC